MFLTKNKIPNPAKATRTIKGKLFKIKPTAVSFLFVKVTAFPPSSVKTKLPLSVVILPVTVGV